MSLYLAEKYQDSKDHSALSDQVLAQKGQWFTFINRRAKKT